VQTSSGSSLTTETSPPVSAGTINSEAAKSGHRMERMVMEDPTVRHHLNTFTGKELVSCKKLHGKKTDLQFTATDGSHVNLQIKKFEKFGGPGDSFHRGKLDTMFTDPRIREGITSLMLNRTHPRATSMTPEAKQELVDICNLPVCKDELLTTLRRNFIGQDEYANHYWMIVHTNKAMTDQHIYIVPSEDLFAYILRTIHIDIKPKKNGTCLHLSPNIVLQRKGGGKTDASPDDIQAKFKITPEILHLCTRLVG